MTFETDADIDAFCVKTLAECVRTGVHTQNDLDLLAAMMGLPENAPVTCLLDEMDSAKPSTLIGRVMAASKGRLAHARVARIINARGAA